jgi:putative acetyltransferase
VITLRPYRPEDEGRVVRLWWDSWHSIRPALRHPQAFSDFQTRWRSEIVPRHEVVIAADGVTVVGFAAADVSARVLSQIFVQPGRKREGIGSRMLLWARARMPEGFRLETLEDNQTSRSFYERHGLTASDRGFNPVNGLPTVGYSWKPPSEGGEIESSQKKPTEQRPEKKPPRHSDGDHERNDYTDRRTGVACSRRIDGR